MKREKGFLVLLLTMLLLLAVGMPQAQVLPIFRIGVLDEPDGPLARGAQLAVQEINSSGGVIGADGTAFELQLVVQSSEDLDFALANITQASVIALIGPADSTTALGNRDALVALGVPILTTATDDTLLASDSSERFMRLRAQDAWMGRALADYIVNDLSAATIATVQLDLESTVSVIGFSRASTQLGLPPTQEYLLSDETSLQRITLDIVASNPQFVVAYGLPRQVADLYTGLRENDWAGRFVYERADEPAFRNEVQESLLGGIISVATWSYSYLDEASQEFLLSYVRAYGTVPTALDAAAYDAVYLLEAAIRQPGALRDNLTSIQEFEGVQGILDASISGFGEFSNNVVVTELGEFGAPIAVARYMGLERVPLFEGTDVTPTPFIPTATPLPNGVYVTITRSVQNVRTGPGLEYDILGQVQEGDVIEVVGATLDFTWVAINFRGTTGWLSRGILELTGDTDTLPVITPPASPTPLPIPPTATAQPIPDIVIVSASPQRLIIGSSFNVLVTVRNQGGSSAGAFAVAASFEPGNVYTAQNIAGLAAGSQVDIVLSGILTGATGPYNVTVVADLNNQINEGAGETNNMAFLYSYIADAPLNTGFTPIGSITLNDLGVATLDGGTDDIQWGGGGIVPLGSTEIGVLTGFTSMDSVHRDAIAAASLANVPLSNVTPGMLIGIQTDSGKFGVLQVISAQNGGQMSFNYRIYNN
jgi:ABC-type branched-subunit amino acid transport system substrate-binding protein